MDLSFLPPLIAGGVIALLSSLITGWIQAIRDNEKFARERAARVEDERHALGRETARRVLEALVSLEHDVMRGQSMSRQDGQYVFEGDLIGRVMTDSKLLTDPRVRQVTWDGMNCLQGAGRAKSKFDRPVFVIQRSIVHHVQEIVSAYLRRDPLPEDSISYVERHQAVIESAWGATD